MGKLWEFYFEGGVSESEGSGEYKSTVLLNCLSVITFCMFVLIAVATYINLSSPIISYMFLFNAGISFSCWVLARKGRVNLAKFILSASLPLVLVFSGAYAKSIGVTNNLILYLAPRILLTITLIIPALLFGYKNLKKMFAGMATGIIVFILFDFIHNSFGVYLEDMPFEKEFYKLFIAMIFLFLLFVIMSIVLLQKVNVENESKLIEQNRELSALNKIIQGAKDIIEENEQRLKSMVQNQGAAVSILDLEGNFVFWNLEAESIFGLSGKGLQNKNIKDFFKQEEMDRLLFRIRTCKPGDKLFREYFGFNEQGEELYIHVVIVPQFENGQLTGLSGVYRDITKLKRHELVLQRKQKKLETQFKSVQDSIQYAGTIQESLLISEEKIKSLIPESFLIFKPKEQVSGDFYVVEKVNNQLIVAVADCTGHGVPGGFISMLGITYLDQIIEKSSVQSSAEVLKQLREKIKAIFHRFGNHNQNGMDMSFCAINTETGDLQFAGANSSLLIARNGELITLRGTKNPIGYYPKEFQFQNVSLKLEKGDMLYLFSDGFQDQFGGPKNKKFLSKRFKEFLLKNSHLTVDHQSKLLNEAFHDWMGKRDQIDDVTVMGIRW